MPYPDSDYEHSWKIQARGVTLYPTARARLFAAAPALRQACEELLIYLGDWDDPENETCAAARRAIAKAKGGE